MSGASLSHLTGMPGGSPGGCAGRPREGGCGGGGARGHPALPGARPPGAAPPGGLWEGNDRAVRSGPCECIISCPCWWGGAFNTSLSLGPTSEGFQETIRENKNRMDG